MFTGATTSYCGSAQQSFRIVELLFKPDVNTIAKGGMTI
jgi:hypothetical protein